MKKYVLVFQAFFLALLLFSSSFTVAAPAKKKILYIDSYHLEYVWSADINAGIRSVLDERDDIELRIFRMDTKRNKSEAFKQEAALKARELISTWKPDVVIASDDNASKYLISPCYRGMELPFVFCGLNWDATVYGFPAKNITGMIEVALYQETIDNLARFAKGKRVGYLASDTVSERKELKNISKRFNLKFNVHFAHTFADLKQGLLDLQKNSDMIILRECLSVKGFNHLDMINFVRENATVPIGTTLRYLKHYALLTFANIGEEQGEYAAKTALAILDGQSPDTIPVVANKKAKIYLNMPLAKAMGIKFPMELLENSHLISSSQKKLLWINSYHKGYQWSDDIEKGLLKALHITTRPDGSFDTSQSEVDLRIYRMDTKRNQSLTFKKKAAAEAKVVIEEWQPDIIVASDDNAAKYLIKPFYKNGDIPIVVNGINWDASEYGFPANNITGMVEVDPVLETLALLRQYAKGPRLGLLAADNLSNRKNYETYRDRLGIEFSEVIFVDSVAQWQEEYLRLQGCVDMLYQSTASVLPGWDVGEAEAFILANTTIPTAATADHVIQYALLGTVKIAEEQGWWAGRTVLRILDGTPPSAIPMVTNRESRLYLNMELAQHLGIKFPMSLLEKATFVHENER